MMDAFRSSLEIKDTPKGKCLHSKSIIPADTVIFEVIGDLVNRDELSDYLSSEVENFFQIDKDKFISMSGDLDDYIAHSCNPNCGLKIVGNRALIVTLYQINPNTQLSLDYSTTSNDTHDSWKMDCKCGTFGCRKIISGFSYLPNNIKDNYKKLGIVPKYLL